MFWVKASHPPRTKVLQDAIGMGTAHLSFAKKCLKLADPKIPLRKWKKKYQGTKKYLIFLDSPIFGDVTWSNQSETLHTGTKLMSSTLKQKS